MIKEHISNNDCNNRYNNRDTDKNESVKLLVTNSIIA